MEKEKSLPPIGDLLRESWQRFRKNLLNLFLLGVISIGLTLVILLIIVGVALVLGLGAVVTDFSPETLGAIQAPVLVSLGVIVLLLFVFFVVVFSAMSIAYILIVGSDGEKISLGGTIKKSFGLIIPLLVVNTLLTFFGVGGFFVLILPAIIFSFLFMFAPYEVIFDGKRFLGAVKGSFQIVRQNIGGILVRLLLFWLASFTIFFFVNFLPNLFLALIGLVDETTESILRLMFMLPAYVVQTLTTWFGLCLLVTLYKQAKEVTDESKPVNFAWVWVVAILGWILAGVVGLASYSWVNKLVKSGLRQKNLEKNIQREILEERELPERFEKSEDWEELQRELERLREEIPQSKFLPEG